MPKKLRGPRQIKAVDPWLFTFGDGTWTFFSGDKNVHETREAAYRHWCECRAEVWAQTNRMRLPKAAMIYDGLTCDAREILWRTWGYGKNLSLTDILQALADDRAAVECFRASDPEGAGDVADFLSEWLHDLGVIEAEANRIAQSKARGELSAGVPQITSARKYGDA